MKKKKKEAPAKSFNEALGIKDMFINERATFIFGLILCAVAIFLIIAFVSYINTADVDQSLLESRRASDLLNESMEFKNSCGSLGAYVSYLPD